MLDRTSAVPLYHQLLELFHQFIESGAWSPGDRIPTENELSEKYGVSKITVRQALAILSKEGRVERQIGRGTFVTERGFDHTLPTLSSISEYLPMGSEKKVEVLEWTLVLPSADVNRHLRLEADKRIYRVRRRILSGNTPVVLQSIYFTDENDIESVKREENHATPLMQLISDATHLEESLEPVALDRYEAELLQLPIGAPTIMVERIIFANETPIILEKSLVARGKIRMTTARGVGQAQGNGHG
jgi:GntR family transcriptional regulator